MEQRSGVFTKSLKITKQYDHLLTVLLMRLLTQNEDQKL